MPPRGSKGRGKGRGSRVTFSPAVRAPSPLATAGLDLVPPSVPSPTSTVHSAQTPITPNSEWMTQPFAFSSIPQPDLPQGQPQQLQQQPKMSEPAPAPEGRPQRARKAPTRLAEVEESETPKKPKRRASTASQTHHHHYHDQDDRAASTSPLTSLASSSPELKPESSKRPPLTSDHSFPIPPPQPPPMELTPIEAEAQQESVPSKRKAPGAAKAGGKKQQPAKKKRTIITSEDDDDEFEPVAISTAGDKGKGKSKSTKDVESNDAPRLEKKSSALKTPGKSSSNGPSTSSRPVPGNGTPVTSTKDSITPGTPSQQHRPRPGSDTPQGGGGGSGAGGGSSTPAIGGEPLKKKLKASHPTAVPVAPVVPPPKKAPAPGGSLFIKRKVIEPKDKDGGGSGSEGIKGLGNFKKPGLRKVEEMKPAKPVLTPEEHQAAIEKQRQTEKDARAAQDAKRFDLLEAVTGMDEFEKAFRLEVRTMLEEDHKDNPDLNPLPRLTMFGSLFSLFPRSTGPLSYSK